jgi:hypothetical protein
MAASGALTPSRPHARVSAAVHEYLIELDVRDVDAEHIVAELTAGGTEIHVPRVSTVTRPLRLIHPEAEAC